jgi:hypothetical protein
MKLSASETCRAPRVRTASAFIWLVGAESRAALVLMRLDVMSTAANRAVRTLSRFSLRDWLQSGRLLALASRQKVRKYNKSRVFMQQNYDNSTFFW